MLYLLDSNIFIEAKNRYYGMDFCPAFWDFLDRQIELQTIISTKNVFDELSTWDDELSDWIKDREDSGFFLPIDDKETQEEFIKISNYVVSFGYTSDAVSTFLDVADPWIIAKAKTLEAILICHEKSSPQAKKIKIPNVCDYFGVKYESTFEMLRNLNAKFILP